MTECSINSCTAAGDLKDADAMNSLVLGALAQTIIDRRMAGAAIFFLEMLKPVRGLMFAGSGAFAPLLGAIVGMSKMDVITKFLADSRNIELLIRELEIKEGHERR